MGSYLYISILLYFGTELFLPILLWPSKRNTNFFISLPAYIVAYFGGSLYLIDWARMEYGIENDVQEFYAIILLLGTFLYLICFILGFFQKNYIYKILDQLYQCVYPTHEKKLYIFGNILGITAILLFCISFYGMGFIPIFAENPFAAKYMADEYQDLYVAFAIPYRTAINLSGIALTLLVIRFLRKKQWITGLLIIGVLICLIFTMRRGIMASTVIAVIFSYMACKSRMKFSFWCICFLVIFCFGSALNDIFYYFIGINQQIGMESVLLGMPDIADHLLFLQKWLSGNWEYTFGTNFFGGLFPYHSEYNLAVLTLKVIGAKAGEVASGGFRLSLPIIGYLSFGWIGIIVIVAVNAYIGGSILRFKKAQLTSLKSKDFILLNTLIFPYFIQVVPNILGMGIGIDTLFSFLTVLSVLIYSKYKIIFNLL